MENDILIEDEKTESKDAYAVLERENLNLYKAAKVAGKINAFDMKLAAGTLSFAGNFIPEVKPFKAVFKFISKSEWAAKTEEDKYIIRLAYIEYFLGHITKEELAAIGEQSLRGSMGDKNTYKVINAWKKYINPNLEISDDYDLSDEENVESEHTYGR